MVQVTLGVAAGVSVAFAALAFAVAIMTTRRRRWLALSLMGVLEAVYCGLMIPFYAARDETESLFWIRTLSVFMPFMCWLVTYLSVEIAELHDHWMQRFSRATFFASALFALVSAVDLSTGSTLLYTGVAYDPASLHQKVVQTTLPANLFLVFADVAFYVSGFFLARHWWRREPILLPLVAGCFLYFLAVTNDFNIVFGFYDFIFLQHYGFLMLYLGLTVYQGLAHVRTVRELSSAHDEIRQHRDRMVQDEKLRSLGLLAAFIGHEINSSLQMITSGTEQLRDKLHRNGSVGREDEHVVSSLATNSSRMARIVSGLRTLIRNESREGFAKTPTVDLIEEALELCRSHTNANRVRIEYDVEETARVMACRPAEIVQLLMNLVQNACDAVVGQPDPWVRVEAKRRADDVVLCVRDSGPGVPVDDAAKIFEPFRTSKRPGEGTGLGLAVVAQIATSHGGVASLDIEAEDTCFVVRLPSEPEELRQADEPISVLTTRA